MTDLDNKKIDFFNLFFIFFESQEVFPDIRTRALESMIGTPRGGQLACFHGVV